MEFEIYQKQIRKKETRVRFPNLNCDFPVMDDGLGHQYIAIPNIYATTCFEKQEIDTWNIKHAIAMIRLGEADGIIKTDDYNVMLIKYLDDKHGKYIRDQVIEAWKGVTFGWGFVLYVSKPSECHILYVYSDTSLYNTTSRPDKEIMFFLDENEAKASYDKIIHDVKKCAKELFDIVDEDSQSQYVKEFYNKHGKTSLYSFLLVDEYKYLTTAIRHAELKIIELAKGI